LIYLRTGYNDPMYEVEELNFEPGQKQEFNGHYGFVLLPDQETVKRAKELASRFAPEAEYKVEFPHITLYHASLRALPLTKVHELMQKLEPLQGEILGLQNINVYGGKFLFWSVDMTDALQDGHEIALDLAKYIDTEGDISALSEDLDLSEEEFQNAYFYGHPLVHKLYDPHITLAYDSNGLSLSEEHEDEYFAAAVAEYAFVEIGERGRIEKIIDVYNA
jgi:2'-5' RNA ligase